MYHHLGKVELEDQIAGVKYLKSLPYVDGSRIGIWGWSYGAYMTLDAMFNAPDVFKAGVAVAPVSDWRLYDTIYTERYMGRPQDNPEGYKQFIARYNQAAKLKGKLMLAHGTGDDNVHFANTSEMLNAADRRTAAILTDVDDFPWPRPSRSAIRRRAIAVIQANDGFFPEESLIDAICNR